MQIKNITSLALLAQAGAVFGASSSAAPTATCEPHDDHWHCPAGVPQPSVLPDGSPNPKATATQAPDHGHDDHDDHDHDHDHDGHDAVTTATYENGCTPHKDHWHCPSGVPKPTTPPPQASQTSQPTSVASKPAGSKTQSAASPTPTSGAARFGMTAAGVTLAAIVLAACSM